MKNKNQSVQQFTDMRKTLPTETTWEQVAHLISSEQLKQSTDSHRAALAEGNTALAQAIKQSMPLIMPAALCSGGRRESQITEYTGMTLVDLDKVGAERIGAMRQRLAQDPYVMLAYVTIGGNGLRIICRYSHLPEGGYLQAFGQVNQHYAELLEADFDPSCKNATRLSVLCHDAGLLYRPEALPFPIRDEETVKVARPAAPRPAAPQPTKPKQNGADEASSKRKRKSKEISDHEMCQTALLLTRRAGRRYLTGMRNDFINVWCCIMAGYGLSREQLRNLALIYFPEHDAENTRSIVKAVMDNPDVPKDRTYVKIRAQVCDMQNWLSDHYELRYNVLKNNVELRVLEPEEPGNEEEKQWKLYDDRTESDIWRLMQLDGLRFHRNEIEMLVGSFFAPDYNPLLEYLDSLPEWDGHDYIADMAGTVHAQLGARLWPIFLKRFLVGMVDCALSPNRANELMIIFLGEQGCYKTTWMERILPPELEDYQSTHVRTDSFDKDNLFAMGSGILISMDEIDVQTAIQANRLKAMLSLKKMKGRRAYGHYEETVPRTASFTGTGNIQHLLNDPTGNRRFFPILVDHIDSPHDYPIDYTGVYSQVYHLWKTKWRYWMNEEEKLELDAHNALFLAPNLERDLVNTYYRVPTAEDETLPAQYRPHYVNTAQVMAYVSNGIKAPLSQNRLGRALKELGFIKKHDVSGSMYYVIERTPTEIRESMPSSLIEEMRKNEAESDENGLTD